MGDDALPSDGVYNNEQSGDSGLGVPVGHAAKVSKLPWHIQVWTESLLQAQLEKSSANRG